MELRGGCGGYRVRQAHEYAIDAQERAPEDAYLGDLGPILRATVGDTINVTLLNRIERALSMHPHGVFYTKANEGAYYNDSTSGKLYKALHLRFLHLIHSCEHPVERTTYASSRGSCAWCAPVLSCQAAILEHLLSSCMGGLHSVKQCKPATLRAPCSLYLQSLHLMQMMYRLV